MSDLNVCDNCCGPADGEPLVICDDCDGVEREVIERMREALRAIRAKAHDYDQTGPATDNRFAEIEEMANDALAATKKDEQ